MNYILSLGLFTCSLLYASFSISSYVTDYKIKELKKEAIIITYDTKDQVIESGDYIITIKKK